VRQRRLGAVQQAHQVDLHHALPGSSGVTATRPRQTSAARSTSSAETGSAGTAWGRSRA
jgi:hypothetical protein